MQQLAKGQLFERTVVPEHFNVKQEGKAYHRGAFNHYVSALK